MSKLLSVAAAKPEWLVLAIGFIHRPILLWCLYRPLCALVAQAPFAHIIQLYPLKVYWYYFWAGLWQLQESPPVPHLIFGLTQLAGGWPLRTAIILCLFQGVISTLTAALLCAVIRKMTRSRAAALSLSLWFLFSTDLVVSEYAFFGQLFYENLAMFILLACCWQAIGLALADSPQPVGRAAMLGIFAALGALTRSSLSYFSLVFGAAHAPIWRKRLMIAYFIPILLLQGGWAVKNALLFGRLSFETSSWGGMNAAKGIFFANQGLYLCDEISKAPPGRYPQWFQAASHQCLAPFTVATSVTLPPELAAQDNAMAARLDAHPGLNMPSVAAESQAWRQAATSFTLRHPVFFAQRFAYGYHAVWQRIADHAVQFPWNLLYVVPVDRPFPGLLSRGFGEKQRMRVSIKQPPPQPDKKAWFGTISLAPLDALAILVLHGIFPIQSAVDGWRRWRGKRGYVPVGTLPLAVAAAYGLFLFSIAEGGENMRFRLTIEPVLIALTAGCLAALGRTISEIWQRYHAFKLGAPKMT